MTMTNILTGDDLKRALFLALYAVKPEKKFVEDIYDMLQTETEKQNMVTFLHTQIGRASCRERV